MISTCPTFAFCDAEVRRVGVNVKGHISGMEGKLGVGVCGTVIEEVCHEIGVFLCCIFLLRGDGVEHKKEIVVDRSAVEK